MTKPEPTIILNNLCFVKCEPIHTYTHMPKPIQHIPKPYPEDVCPDVGAEDDDEPVEDHCEGRQTQRQEPEPDKDVDLLIDCKQIVNQY